MNNDQYRQLARNAILQAIPLEILELVHEICVTSKARGQAPEEVFKRVLATQHSMIDAPHDAGSILQQLAELGAIPPQAWQGMNDE